MLVPHCAAGRSGDRDDTVEIAERVGRGDCDYWLTADKDSKVNVGVFTGPDNASLFEGTKGIGTPEPVNLGDEAYSIFNESIGTVVVARKGDATVIVQVLTGSVAADQLRQGTELVGDRSRGPLRRARGDDRALARAHCHGSRLKVQSRRPLASSIASNTTAKPRAT